MERLVLRTARKHIYGKLAICLAAVGVGAALVSIELTSWLGCGRDRWSSRVDAAAGLGEDTERIVIDDAGIRDSHLPLGILRIAELISRRAREGARW